MDLKRESIQSFYYYLQKEGSCNHDLAIRTGMRQELIGLKWEDVNWKLGKLQVKRHARHFKGDSYTFTELKSESGVRTIELGKRALELLKEHRQEQQLRVLTAKISKNPDLIFPPMSVHFLPQATSGETLASL